MLRKSSALTVLPNTPHKAIGVWKRPQFQPWQSLYWRKFIIISRNWHEKWVGETRRRKLGKFSILSRMRSLWRRQYVPTGGKLYPTGGKL
ncbi:MAG: hypothetical protein J7647_01900 [Cyanobacteria bacterium SBLK]|nr:hypothetical protein [Cyanobacteria bacterium SBLK]